MDIFLFLYSFSAGLVSKSANEGKTNRKRGKLALVALGQTTAHFARPLAANRDAHAAEFALPLRMATAECGRCRRALAKNAFNAANVRLQTSYLFRRFHTLILGR